MSGGGELGERQGDDDGGCGGGGDLGCMDCEGWVGFGRSLSRQWTGEDQTWYLDLWGRGERSRSEIYIFMNVGRARREYGEREKLALCVEINL